MRAAFVVLLLILAGGLAFWFGSGAGEPVPPVEPGVDAPPAPKQQPTPAAGEGLRTGAEAVATRAAAEPGSPADLADRPTACLLVVDHGNGAPIAGAAIRRMKDGAEIGFTDERGLAELPLREREQLAVLADRYLMRMAATRLGSTSAEPQRVALVKDRWSVWHRFELRAAADGSAVDEAFVTIAAQGEPGAASHEDPVVQRAREEDLRLTGLLRPPASSTLLENGAELRFSKGRAYELELGAAGGLVATLRLEPSDRDRRIRVDLLAGDWVDGVVLGDKGSPLAGAVITRRGGGPLGLQCTTGGDGRFSFGPLPRGKVTLLVRHPDHEPVAFGEIGTSDEPTITLRELPRSTLRGRVRRRPDLEPIAGATVSWSATANPPVTAVTGADGTFRLAATGDVAGRLLVSAPGCIALAELVAPGAPFADYDLLPSSTAERVDKKLTAVLAGVVFDGQSRPAGGVTVRWIPDDPPAGPSPSGRRTISGHALLLPLSVTTAADGSFELETAHLGRGRLALSGDGGGVATVAVAGTRKDGHRLQQR